MSPEEKRLSQYRLLARAFSYPEGEFFGHFPELLSEKDYLLSEYDRLFRLEEIWLYTTEHLAQNEFQRANYLADIMGFYKAFGLEPKQDRPDLLSSEFEFMWYLIFKKLYALREGEKAEKAEVCFEAERKFFLEHLYLAVQKIASAIISKSSSGFYVSMAKEALKFVKAEGRFFKSIAA